MKRTIGTSLLLLGMIGALLLVGCASGGASSSKAAPETYKSTSQSIKPFSQVAKGIPPYSTAEAKPTGMHTYTYIVEGMPLNEIDPAMTAYSNYLTSEMGYKAIGEISKNLFVFEKNGKKVMMGFAGAGAEDQVIIALDD